VGGTAAFSMNVVSSTQITAFLNAHTRGTSASGNESRRHLRHFAKFLHLYHRPGVRYRVPGTAAASGGTAITITGQRSHNFTSGVSYRPEYYCRPCDN